LSTGEKEGQDGFIMGKFITRGKKKNSSSAKEKMLAEAAVLFWKKGYEGTSLRDIAQAYGCRPANFYNFFRDKESLLFEILLSQMKAVVSSIEHLEEDEAASPVAKLRELIIRHATYTLKNTRTSKLLFDVGLDSLTPSKRAKIVELRNSYDRILQKIIHRGIQTGDFVDLDKKLVGYGIASMIVRSNIWYSPEGRLSMEEVIDFLVRFILNGLRRRGLDPKGHRKISKTAPKSMPEGR
jgi:TetR/AcrR family transcriptional regulator, cholesterol catabolism regulator